MRTLLVIAFASGCLCRSREEKLQAAEDEGNLLVPRRRTSTGKFLKSKLREDYGEHLMKKA